ncbi:MAG: ABC transporter substrate-binding protein, partial [Clostridium sp.]
PGSSFEDTAIKTNGAPFFNVDNYEADLQKAKDLMAEAGYPDGAGFPTIEYMTNDSGYNKPIAEYLQSAWKEIGVNMDIKIVEWSTFTPTRRNGDYDVARNGWVYDYDDPSNMLNLLETGNGNNDGKYSNPEYDALIEKARNTADKAEHYALLHEAENLALKDSAMIPVVSYNDFWLQSTKLKGTWHTPYGFWNFMYGTLE